MRMALVVLAAVMVSAAAQAQTPSNVASDGPIHVVTYLETRPAWSDKAAAALRDYVSKTGSENGARRVRLFAEHARGNRLVVEEVWQNAAAYEAHAKSSDLAARLTGGHLAPPDIRVHTEWSVSTDEPAWPATALVGFTHIDVPPPRLAELEAILRPYVEMSRSDPGVLRFDILQGLAPRRNHLTLAEIWRDAASFQTHQTSGHAIAFRDALGPLLGALYDQRLYGMMP